MLKLVQNIHLISILVPLFMGFFSFMVRDRKTKVINLAYMWLSFLMFCFTVYATHKLNLIRGETYYSVIGNWTKAMGIELKVNLVRSIMVMALFLMSILFFATTWKGGTDYAFRGFVCVMLCGANGIVLTNDIFNSYVFFEIVCITNYIIYAHGSRAECVKNAYNYMILSSFAGVVFLLAAGVLYQITGNLNLDIIRNSLSTLKDNKTVNAIYVLFLLAMMFKLGVYPLHNVLFGIYRNLQLKYLFVVAGISSIVYPFFIMKMVISLFGTDIVADNEYLNMVLKICGGIGFLFFNVMAFTSKSVVHFIVSLAFAQTSLFAFCVPYFNNAMMTIGVALSIVSTSLIKACMLAMTYKFQCNFGIVDIKKIDLSAINSGYKFAFALLLFIISGMPFTMVFMSKWYSLIAVINSAYSPVWAAIIIVGFAIDISACFGFIMQILTRNSSRNVKICMNKIFLYAVAFIVLFVVFGAMFVGYLNNFTN